MRGEASPDASPERRHAETDGLTDGRTDSRTFWPFWCCCKKPIGISADLVAIRDDVLMIAQEIYYLR